MRIALNAEVWAAARVGIFFPAHNQTPADGNLTGQCVTLNKWFLYEMTNVPNPFSARGDARYVGKTLVAQGHAVQVPYEQRRRGDFAVFEYGTYGHIGVLLDQDRIFEQNANVGGVARRLITEGKDSWYVYASRVGRLSESWRPVRATIYRIKSYMEDEIMDNPQDIRNIGGEIWGRAVEESTVKALTGKSWHDNMYWLLSVWPWTNRKGAEANNAKAVQTLSKQVGDLTGKNVQLVADNATLKETNEKAIKENIDLKAQLAAQSEDTKNLNALGVALQWLIKRLGLNNKENTNE